MVRKEVRVELSRIIINEQSPEQVIVLKEKDGLRQMPISIGIFEAWSIERRIKEASVPRPMTHDLLANVIVDMGGELQRVVITDCSEGTFFAVLCVHQGKKNLEIDCRPSDAVALAVRVEAPIMVDERVFGKISGSG